MAENKNQYFNNVIDLNERRKKKQQQVLKKGKKTSKNAAPIVDMTERRQEILTEERRKVKRTILSEFVGAFMVVPNKGLQRVALYDISDGGIAFDVDISVGGLVTDEEYAMRVYLNQQTYFPFVVRVLNAREVYEEQVFRMGARFVRGTVNEVALHHFVKFIESVSASLQTDHGDVVVSNLK